MKTFNEIANQDRNNLMVVDALNLAFRWKHSGATDFAEEYVKVVDSLARSYKAKHVIIASDHGSSVYRKEIFPEYKQNRKDKFENQTEAEKQAFEEFFEEFSNTLELLAEKYPVLRFKGVEADDIASVIATNFKNTDHSELWLISSDRDWDLLVGPKISRFSYVTRKEVTNENWNEHYDFDISNYIDIKCLMGDSGDNINGVPSVGPKRAISLIKEYGTIWDIIEGIPLAGKYKYIQELNNCKDILERNFKLMSLVDFQKDALLTKSNMDEVIECL